MKRRKVRSCVAVLHRDDVMWSAFVFVFVDFHLAFSPHYFALLSLSIRNTLLCLYSSFATTISSCYLGCSKEPAIVAGRRDSEEQKHHNSVRHHVESLFRAAFDYLAEVFLLVFESDVFQTSGLLWWSCLKPQPSTRLKRSNKLLHWWFKWFKWFKW